MKPPLAEDWERVAMKELSDMAHFLAHGMFLSADDLVERMENAIDTIQQMQQLKLDIHLIRPSTHPEANDWAKRNLQ